MNTVEEGPFYFRVFILGVIVSAFVTPWILSLVQERTPTQDRQLELQQCYQQVIFCEQRLSSNLQRMQQLLTADVHPGFSTVTIGIEQ